MASKSSAIQKVNQKGERITVPAKGVHRYRAGKLPSKEDASPSSSDSESNVTTITTLTARTTLVKHPPPSQPIRIESLNTISLEEVIIAQQSETFKKEQFRKPTSTTLSPVKEATTQVVNPRLQRILAAKARREAEMVGVETRDEEFDAVQKRQELRAAALKHREEEEQTLSFAHLAPPATTRPLSPTKSSVSKLEPEASSEEESYDEDDEDESGGVLLKPVFVVKSLRETVLEREKQAEEEELAEMKRAEQRAHRIESSRKLVQTLRREEEARKNRGEDDAHVPDVDDRDGMDEEGEYFAWVEREKARMKRAEEERIELEAEKKEKARRAAMTEEERRKEDEERLTKERAEEEQRKETEEKPRFMQKYYHKGAFFQDVRPDLLNRNFMAPTINEPNNRDVMPTPLQVRNFGKSSQTKWTHLVAEDTTQKDAGWTQESDVTKRTMEMMGGMKDDLNFLKRRKRI